MHRLNTPIIITMLFTLPGLLFAEEIRFDLPPTSLAQWYKPLNKRQVWLHTMFRLRREMQAVESYAAEGDKVLTKKWAQRLVEDYRQIAEMVPEWQDEVELEWAGKLETAAEQGNFEMIALAQKKLNHSCTSCHNSFRAQAAVLYRVPDYANVSISMAGGKKVDYPEIMRQLTQSMNQVKIALEDERWLQAENAVTQLGIELNELKKSCSQCHNEPDQESYILGDESRQLLQQLKQLIQQKAREKSARLLGKSAVVICADCHGIHRFAGDIRKRLVND